MMRIFGLLYYWIITRVEKISLETLKVGLQKKSDVQQRLNLHAYKRVQYQHSGPCQYRKLFYFMIPFPHLKRCTYFYAFICMFYTFVMVHTFLMENCPPKKKKSPCQHDLLTFFCAINFFNGKFHQCDSRRRPRFRNLAARLYDRWQSPSLRHWIFGELLPYPLLPIHKTTRALLRSAYRRSRYWRHQTRSLRSPPRRTTSRWR